MTTPVNLTVVTREPMPPASNRSIAKVVDRLQQGERDPAFRNLLSGWLFSQSRVAWDDHRVLFWVNHPDEGWQVAVWMMDASMQFQPTGEQA